LLLLRLFDMDTPGADNGKNECMIGSILIQTSEPNESGETKI
jgi:hypothetical protein